MCCQSCDCKNRIMEKFRSKWGTDSASIFLRSVANRLTSVKQTEQTVLILLELAEDLQG